MLDSFPGALPKHLQGQGHREIEPGQHFPCRDQLRASVWQNHQVLLLLHFMHKTAVEDLSKAVWADQKEIAGGFLALGFSLGPYFFSTVPVPFLQLSVYTESFTLSSHALAGYTYVLSSLSAGLWWLSTVEVRD